MNTDLTARITADLTAAMKSRDALRLEVLRGLKSELKYRQIELVRPLDEAECQTVLRSAQKKRRDAIEFYQKGGREDLWRKEESELAIISEYLPAPMGDDELKGIVDTVIGETQASSPADLGRVMKDVMGKVIGRADGNRVRQVVAERLNGMVTSQ
jgi:hypothetical protein